LNGATASASQIIAGVQRLALKRGNVDSDLEVPAQLPGLMRAYINGELELDPFLAAVFPLWRDGGWGPYFDRSNLSAEQLVRAEAFERRFAELTSKK
jgi:hypothetical protein